MQISKPRESPNGHRVVPTEQRMSSNEYEGSLDLRRSKPEKNQRGRSGLEEVQTLGRYRPKEV